MQLSFSLLVDIFLATANLHWWILTKIRLALVWLSLWDIRSQYLQFGKLYPGEYSLISNIYISAESQQKLVNIYGGKCLLQDSNLTLFGQYQPLKYTYHASLVNTDQIQA